MDIGAISANLDKSIHNSGMQVQEKMAGDLSNPEQMLRAQFALQNYAQMIQMQATFTKKVDDMISGVISKI